MYSAEITENSSDTTDVETTAEKQLEVQIENFLNYYYRQKDLDVLDFKKMFKKRFLFNYEWAEFEKSVDVSDIVFDIIVDIEIKRDGIMIK